MAGLTRTNRGLESITARQVLRQGTITHGQAPFQQGQLSNISAGRNFDEVLRVIDALQLTAKHKVATPADWIQGEDVLIAGSVSDDEARKMFPQGWKAPLPYLRIVTAPK